MGIFEALMLLCFGAAWPVNLAKAWRARTAVGQSASFLLIVLLGYLSVVALFIKYFTSQIGFWACIC